MKSSIVPLKPQRDASPSSYWLSKQNSPVSNTSDLFHFTSSSTDFEFRSDEQDTCTAQAVPPSIEIPRVDRSTRSCRTGSVSPISPLSETDEIQNKVQFCKFRECLQVYECEKAKADRALLRAVRSGNLNECSSLLNGTLPDYTAASASLRTALNDTLLHVACRLGHTAICQLLLQHGVLQEGRMQNDLGQTPLHIVCELGNAEIVKMLVKTGADLRIGDNEGNTPLHTAALAHHFEIAKYLRLSGADASLRNKQGRTAGECQAMKTLTDLRKAFKVPPFKPPPRSHRLSLPVKSMPPVPSPGDFEILSLLGKGSFGEVYVVRDKATNEKFAMKVMKKDMVLGQNMTKYAFTERNVLCRMRHPFVVGIHSAFQSAEDLFLVLDYCPGGDLGKYLSREKRFNEYKARIYICEVVLALEELHRSDIIYRDLKPDNIVLSADGHAVLTDFGLAKEGVSDNYAAKSFCGSMGYLAPEMLKKQGHGKAADWYMLGILLYELLTGALPYFSRDKDLFMRNIERGKLSLPDNLSGPAKNLLTSVSARQLLNRNPDDRLGSGPRGSEEIKEHPFFDGIVWTQVSSKGLKPPKPSSPDLFTKPVGHIPVRVRDEEDARRVAGWEYVRDPAAD